MKKLLQFLTESIVAHPKAVTVAELTQSGLTVLTVKAHPEDIKIIIGRGGQTIKALREIIKIKSLSDKKRVEIQVEEA